MLFKTIIFSDVPVLKGFKYRDRFQLVPFFYSKSAPISEYAKHFPAFLEFEADAVEEGLLFEDKLKEAGLSEDTIKKGRLIPNQERVKREILQLLTCLTNYHFFSYDSSFALWGVQIPSNSIDDINLEEFVQHEDVRSKWTFGCYLYPGLKKDLIIDKYTQVFDYYDTNSSTENYFTNNPGAALNLELSFPQYLDYCLDRYYMSDGDIYKRTKYCMGLLSDGVALFDTKRSVSLLAIISSIEGMALMDYEMYGEAKGLGAKSRFTRYLRRYVAGRSTEKYEAFYAKRCSITHEGEVFVGDLDMFSSIDEQHNDWLFRLEILQAARVALYHWLRRRQ